MNTFKKIIKGFFLGFGGVIALVGGLTLLFGGTIIFFNGLPDPHTHGFIWNDILKGIGMLAVFGGLTYSLYYVEEKSTNPDHRHYCNICHDRINKGTGLHYLKEDGHCYCVCESCRSNFGGKLK